MSTTDTAQALMAMVGNGALAVEELRALLAGRAAGHQDPDMRLPQHVFRLLAPSAYDLGWLVGSFERTPDAVQPAQTPQQHKAQRAFKRKVHKLIRAMNEERYRVQ